MTLVLFSLRSKTRFVLHLLLFVCFFVMLLFIYFHWTLALLLRGRLGFFSFRKGSKEGLWHIDRCCVYNTVVSGMSDIARERKNGVGYAGYRTCRILMHGGDRRSFHMYLNTLSDMPNYWIYRSRIILDTTEYIFLRFGFNLILLCY